MAPRVFVTYSHGKPDVDPADHDARVLELTQQLRRDGFDAVCDQMVAFPPDGWLKWMTQQIREARWVVLVGSRTYKRSSDDVKTGGKGAAWEFAQVEQELYETQLRNGRIVPVLFDGSPEEVLPDLVRKYTHFRLDVLGREGPRTEGYVALLRVLHERPAVVPEPIGQAPDLPPLDPRPAKARGATPIPRAEGYGILDDANAVFLASRGPLVGRERELAELADFLRAGEGVRVVGGLGGVGKTTLVKAALRGWVGKRNPVAYVVCDEVEPRLGLSRALFSIDEAPWSSIAEALRGETIFLDALERVVGQADPTRWVLDTLPGARVVATSRYGGHALHPLAEDAAAALLAGQWNLHARFEDHISVAQAASAVRRLGCLPLTLSLAARFAATRRFDELFDGWKPTDGVRDEQGLKAVLEAIHGALSSGARALWSLVALAEGSLDADSFQALRVPLGYDLAAREQLELWALVSRDEHSLTMLDPVREWALERDMAGVIATAGEYVTGLAQAVADSRFRGDAGHRREVVGRAVPLLMGVWRHGDLGVVEACARALYATTALGVEFYPAWLIAEQRARGVALGHTLECIGDLESRLGDVQGARRRYEDALRVYEREPDNAGRANALQGLGDLERRLGDLEAARGYHQEALELFVQERDNVGLANALHSLGDLERRHGDVGAARRRYEEALALYEQVRDGLGRANTVRSLGDLASRLGDVEGARRRYEEALDLYKLERNNLGRANTLRSVGDLESRLGDVEAARRRYEEALDLYKQERDNLGRANTLRSVGDLESRLGDVEVARRRYEEALRHYEQQQDSLGRANTLRSVGDLESRLGNLEGARRKYEDALGLFAQARDNLGRANTLQGLGDLERRLGDVEGARGRYEEALGLYAQERANLGRANTLQSLGDLEIRLGDVEGARGRYAEALGLFAQERDNLGRANTLRSLGDLEIRLGDVEGARGRYAEALGLYEQERDNLGRANTLLLLGVLERTARRGDAARSFYETALGLFVSVRDPTGEAYALADLAQLETRPDARTALLQRATDAAQRSGVPSVVAYVEGVR